MAVLGSLRVQDGQETVPGAQQQHGLAAAPEAAA